jgi:hypothetical protein
MNTQVVDTVLVLLAFVTGLVYSGYLFKRQRTSVKRVPLFVVLTAGFWCLFNWIGHIVAVLVVNLKPIWSGTFTYSFHFYSLLLMGVVFMLLSFIQVNLIRLMSEGSFKSYRALKQVSGCIILFSLPIFPLNPIGLLPVISSVMILTTITFTRKSWVVSAGTENVELKEAVVA